MSSTDRMRDASLIRSEILQKISLRPYHFRQLLDTKSSSSMRRITQQTTYNSYLGRLQRSFLATADLSSPVISKIKSLNLFPYSMWLHRLLDQLKRPTKTCLRLLQPSRDYA